MTDELHIGVGGAWKQADEVHIGVGGAWKDCDEVYVGVGGVWKRVFAKVTFTITWTSLAYEVETLGSGEVHDLTGIRLLNDGNTEITNINGSWGAANSLDWGDPVGTVPGANYEAMWTHISGSVPDAAFAVDGVYADIDVTLAVQLNAGGTGGDSSVFDLTVGEKGDVSSRITRRVTLTQGSTV